MTTTGTDFTDYKYFSFLKIHYLIALYFLSCTFSIGISESILFLIALLWCYGLLWKRELFAYKKSGLELWLLAYILVSILAIIFSSDFSLSISHAKHFSILAVFIFGSQALMNGAKVRLYLSMLVLGGLINAVYAFFRFAALGEGGLQRRLHGFIGSWMTFSGFMMIIILLLLARIIWTARSRATILYAFAALFLIIVLVLSMTRNSWVGLFFGVLTLCFLHSRKIFVFGLGLIIVLGIISTPFLPTDVKARFRSIFTTKDTTNRDRIYMATIAVNIIKKHPLLGIGPGTLGTQLQYYVSEGIDKNWRIPHLHNNILQIAAVKGLLGLAAWLLFFLKWFYDSLRFYFTNKSCCPDLIAGAIACIVAFQIAGLFEYNFGDSEILMLILFIMAIPYALSLQNH
jgi:O-antigen ligase